MALVRRGGRAADLLGDLAALAAGFVVGALIGAAALRVLIGAVLRALVGA